jgi:hypothetical protein
MKLLTLTLALALLAFGAKKERNWKTGRVLDSNTTQQSYVTGSVTNTTGTATTVGGSTATTSGSSIRVGNTTTMSSSTTASGSATTTENSTSTTSLQRVSLKTNELLIVGDDYLYIIEDTVRTHVYLLAKKLAERHHGCRFVVGEDVKYSQEKGDLWVIDADAKECKVAILRQEKKNIEAVK